MDDLPPDVLVEILLRLPAKQLCRLRAVCRSWNSLLFSPLFAKAHTARHPEPLLVAKDADDTYIDVMDLAGNVVKRIDIKTTETAGVVPREHHQPAGPAAYLVQTKDGIRVVDPASGAVSALPDSDEQHLDGQEQTDQSWYSYSLGRVASTGQYKVLRIFHDCVWRILPSVHPGLRLEQTCDVLTLGDGSSRPWRRRRRPPVNVCTIHTTVVQGVVYIMLDEFCSDKIAAEPDCVASFDLETEEWAPVILRGPPSSRHHDGPRSYFPCRQLAELNGYLVMVERHVLEYGSMGPWMDLWFLFKDTWVREHRVRRSNSIYDSSCAVPMFVLGDGRVLLRAPLWGEALIMAVGVYDPRTGTCTDTARLAEFGFVGLYTAGKHLLMDQ